MIKEHATPVPGLLTTIAPAVAATPAVPVLPGTVAKPVVAKPKESTKPGEKRKLEAADTEAKPTTHEKASAGTTNGQTAKK
ncbi:hypothetical protein ON010_g9666 [Phytophthora cinnamomi]|nr:hypothetical protein ON010_g9666 [Phytophthora cinnamomi]